MVLFIEFMVTCTASIYEKAIPECRLSSFHLLSSLLIEIAPIRPLYRGKSVLVRLRVGTDNGAIASHLENIKSADACFQ